MKMQLQREREAARKLYLDGQKTMAQVAAEVGTGRRTVSRWAVEGRWTQLRRSVKLNMPRPALDALRHQRALLIREVDTETIAPLDKIDALHKLNLTIEKMEARLEPIGPMLEGMSRFARFVAARSNDADCAVVREWVGKFLAEEKSRRS